MSSAAVVIGALRVKYASNSLSGKTSFQDISSDWMIPDTHDNEAPAIVVYSAVFKFYQKHLQKTLVNHTGHDETHPVRWVIVVPATWNDSAREFLLAATQEVSLLLRVHIQGKQPSLVVFRFPPFITVVSSMNNI